MTHTPAKIIDAITHICACDHVLAHELSDPTHHLAPGVELTMVQINDSIWPHVANVYLVQEIFNNYRVITCGGFVKRCLSLTVN